MGIVVLKVLCFLLGPYSIPSGQHVSDQDMEPGKLSCDTQLIRRHTSSMSGESAQQIVLLMAREHAGIQVRSQEDVKTFWNH